MKQILETIKIEDYAAGGRFFIPEITIEQDYSNGCPVEAAARVAKKIDCEIFEGENGEIAQSLYRIGLMDIINSRTDTPEAMFYCKVQKLSSLVGHLIDKPMG